MANYKTWSKQRYLFFWLALLVYFVPYIVVTSCLLPMMKVAEGRKIAVGFVVVMINAYPLLRVAFHNLFNHLPFLNVAAILFCALAVFFASKFFETYVYTFLWIEGTVTVSSIAASVFWILHKRYKRQCQTVKTVIKSGLINKE